MKVVLVEPPLVGHKNRGTGVYLTNLFSALEKEGVEVELVDIKHIPHDADIIHFPYFDPFFLTLPFSLPKNTVITVHDLIPFVFPMEFPRGVKGEFKWGIQKMLLSRAKAVITDSVCSQMDIIKYAGIKKEKIFPIYLAPGNEFKRIEDIELLSSVRAKYKLPDKFILYVGDLNYSKNITGLIEAFYTLRKKLDDIHVVIIGEAFMKKEVLQYQEMMSLINELSIDKFIHSLGLVPLHDLACIYNLADTYFQPSWYEGFGLPVLEAMRCGCPVVATETASLSEIGGTAAVYVDPHNLNNMSDGLYKVLTLENKMREEMVRNSLSQAKKFSWRKTARATIKVYNQVLTAK